MFKKRDFWIGFVTGGFVIFFYAWLAVWGTYVGLERAHLEREIELRAVKKILYYGEDIQSQREEIIEWNRKSMISAPEWAEAEEEQ